LGLDFANQERGLSADAIVLPENQTSYVFVDPLLFAGRFFWVFCQRGPNKCRRASLQYRKKRTGPNDQRYIERAAMKAL
jgi:hypothetical protein